MPPYDFWFAFTVATLVGLAAVAGAIAALRRWRVIDIPNHRSSHGSPTPRGGGIALVVAIVFGALTSWPPAQAVGMILAGIVVLGALGFLDDIRGLAVWPRLIVMTLSGGSLALLVGGPLPSILLAGLGAVWFAAYVNAFNFMDGINGIAALTSVVAGLSYAAMGIRLESNEVVVIGAALTGASLAFLPYNFPRARIFLGDAGSYALGFTIAALAWLAWSQGASPILAISPTLIYLADTSITLFRRYRSRAKVTEAHRQHVYQRMVDAGLSHTAVAMGYAIATALVVASSWFFGLGGAITTMLAAAATGTAALRRAEDFPPTPGLDKEATS